MPALGYYHLGSRFSTIALFLLFRFVNERRKSIFELLIIGFFFGLSILSHPGFIFSITAIIPTFFYYKEKNKSIFLALFIGITLSFFFVFYDVNLNDLIKSYYTQKKFVAETLGISLNFERLLNILSNFINISPYSFKVIFIFLFVLFFLRLIPTITVRFVSIFIVPSIYLLVLRVKTGGIGHYYLVTFYGLLFVYLWLLYKDKGFSNRLFFFLFLPSFLQSFALSFTATTFLIQYNIGILPAFISTLILFSLWIRDKDKKAAFLFEKIPFFFLILNLLYIQWNSYCGEYVKNSEIKYMVSMGPFKGLRTTFYKKELLENLTLDIKKFSFEKGRIVFLCRFSAGYLFTKMNPGTPSIFGCNFLDKYCNDKYKKYLSETTLVIEIKKNFRLIDWETDCDDTKKLFLNEMNPINAGNFTLKKDTKYYRIYVRTPFE